MTQRRSESNCVLALWGEGRCLELERGIIPIDGKLAVDGVGFCSDSKCTEDERWRPAKDRSTSPKSMRSALVTSSLCEPRPVRGKPGHMSTTKEVPGLSVVWERAKVIPNSVWWKIALSLQAMSFSS